MIVYKAKNKLNNKCYIGKTTKSLEERMDQHIKHSEKGKSKFFKALKSYGADNFEWEIIYTAETLTELDEQEKYYIKLYDSINEGYNMVEGGTGGYNEYAVIANRKKRKGKSYEEIYSSNYIISEIKNNLSKNMIEHNKVYGFNNMNKERRTEIARIGAYAKAETGYTHSEETRKKISEAQKGITHMERYGEDGAKLASQKISEATKKAMKKVNWDELMQKALDSRKKYWNAKHEQDRERILELLNKGVLVKNIMAELNISAPTYYARVGELKNMGKL
jgi:group I intron endonuclease